MKKKSILILLLLLLILTGCAKHFYYDIDTLENKVISAEIVEPFWDVDRFNFKIVNKVEDSKINALLNDLTKFEFISYRGGPISPNGFALKLNYKDGYEVIYDTRIIWFNNADEFIKQEFIFTPDGFSEFLLKYTL